MRKCPLLCAFALSASLAFGQLDPNSITVTASRTTALQADQVVFLVNVTSGLETTLDDVVAALAGSGITAANFTGLSSGYSGLILTGNPTPNPSIQPSINWTFTLAVPLTQLKATATMLTTLQQDVGKKNSGLTLTFSVQGTRVSQQLQQSQVCSVADLLSDASAQAQKMASAAGVSLGGILAMSSVTTSSSSSGLAGLSAPLFAPTCSLTVKFGLVHL